MSDISASTGQSQEEGGLSIDFGRILHALKKHFWIILLCLILGVVGAVAFLNVATPIFASRATIKVEQRVDDATPLMSSGGSSVEDLRSLEMISTIMQGFTSRSIMERISKALNLVNREGFLPAGTPADEKEALVLQTLMLNTKAELVRGTRLFQLSFEHPNADIVPEVVGALIRENKSLDADQRLQAASGSLDFLQRERGRLEKQLRESEETLSTYTTKLGSVSVSNELNIIAEQLRELNSRLTVAKAERLKLQADFDQLEGVRDDPDALLQIASIAALPPIQSLRQQLNDIDGEISKTRQRYGTKSPQLAELLSRSDGLRQALKAEALRAPLSLEITLRAATQNENSLEKETRSQERKTLEVQKLAIQSSVLQRQIEADNIAYQAILQKFNEEMVRARSQSVFLQVMDPPSPAYQVKPRPLIVAAVAFILSMGFAGAIVLVLALLDTSFKTADDVEVSLGVNVMAAVPRYIDLSRVGKGKGKSSEGAMVSLEDHHSPASEAFRTLRASLLLLEKDHPCVLMTSAVPGEGKSYCALNLAAALAQQETPTVIVDADLRRPVLEERIFGSKRDAPGLADFLMGRADFDDVVRETTVPHLFVVTAGRHCPNPSELLLRRERFQQFVDLIEKRFERAVFDSAPVLAVSDTLNIARHFKAIGIVVRSHRTPRRPVQRAIELFARSGYPVAGIVLNLVPAGGGGQYYYYSYGSDTPSAAESTAEPAGRSA